MIIVDTSVWVDALRGTENLKSLWLRRNFGDVHVGLTDLILCEVLQGIRDPGAFVHVQRRLSTCPVFNTGGQDLAVAAAGNYRRLRTRGITVRKTIDCLIATFCIAEGHALLHNDRDFDPFEEFLGLRVVHPSLH
ncbi:MAG: PIN domain nuclease [Acidobacteriaceae bacterium]|jgi:predicted nucleic acid-binding protein